MSSFQCDPKLANVAIEALRFASEQIPAAEEKEKMSCILKEVKEANATIAKCEKSYQEKARLLNSTIAHSVSSYVDKELSILEKEVRAPILCNPADLNSIETCYQKLLKSKEKLFDLFDLVSGWGWSHLRQTQMERIAELFEKINENAEKIGHTLVELANHLPDEEKRKLMEQQTKFLGLMQLGGDRINPDQIFSA